MRLRSLRILIRPLLNLLILTSFSTGLFGQTTQLQGRVLDETGGVVPVAEVTLTNQSTQMSRSQMSDELGRYQFPNLPPGVYTVKVELPGFKTQTIQGIRLLFLLQLREKPGYNADEPFDWNTFTSKLDFNLTDSQSLFIRGNYQWDHDTLEPYWPDSLSNRQWSHPTGLSTGHIWTIQPNLVNDFRYGLTRQAYSNSGDTIGDSIVFSNIYENSWGSRPIS